MTENQIPDELLDDGPEELVTMDAEELAALEKLQSGETSEVSLKHDNLLAPYDAGGILSDEDWLFVSEIVGTDELGWLREPDKVISPEGQPYLNRWFVIKDKERACVYLHIFLASDPDRPLHDHPWASHSLIVSGECNEIVARIKGRQLAETHINKLKPGDMRCRTAEEPHRVLLANNSAYMITIFTTGPKVREWGFWTEDGFIGHKEFVASLGSDQ